MTRASTAPHSQKRRALSGADVLLLVFGLFISGLFLLPSNPALAAQPKPEFVFLGLDLEGLDACIPCSLVEMMATTASDMGEKAHTVMRTGVTGFLVAVFGIYILLQAGKLLLPFGPLESAAGVFNAVMTRTLVIIAALSFLVSFGNYWSVIHTPPLVGALNLTSLMMAETKQNLTFIPSDKDYLIGNTCPTVTTTTSDSIAAAMSCTMRNAQETVAMGLYAGILSMLSNSMSGNIIERLTTGLAGMVVAFFGAGVLVLVYAPIYLSMPLKMADIILRWTLLSVISPLVIAAAVFPVTRSFLFAALKGVMQAAFELVMYGIVIAFGAEAMDVVMDELRQDDGILAVSLNMALFWQLLLIGFIIGSLLDRARGVAIALTDPTPNPSGMHTAAVEEMGQKAAAQINSSASKGMNWATNVWKSRTN